MTVGVEMLVRPVTPRSDREPRAYLVQNFATSYCVEEHGTSCGLRKFMFVISATR